MVDFLNNDHEEVVPCRYCHSDYSIRCDKEDFRKWKQGEGYIQDLLGYLSASERELLISGTCDKCWKSMFGEDEEDEE